MEEVESSERLAYVNRPDDILSTLLQSKTFGTVVGIFAISLGPTMVMTAVDDIIDVKNDKIIVLRETDLLGLKLVDDQILLSEIVRVHSFKTLFDDPFHVKLRNSFSSNRK